jgi:DNA-binding response OmpR family regulator
MSSDKDSEQTPSEPGAAKTAPERARILVIEDDSSISLGLSMNLQAEGYAVELAEDGEAGLSRAQEGDIDLIILDVMLPRLNGFEVLRTLRGGNDHVPIIVLSARGAETDKVMGLELGAEDYVTKPFGLAVLAADAELQVGPRGATGRLRPFDELAHTVAVQLLERAHG